MPSSLPPASCQPSPPPADLSSLCQLYPELSLASQLSLLAGSKWSPLLDQSPTTISWLRQQQRLFSNAGQPLHSSSHLPSSAVVSQRQWQSLSKEQTLLLNRGSLFGAATSKDKVPFSIDNIINGKYEESIKPAAQVQQPMDQPSSPSACSTLSESTNMNGIKYECEICSKTYSTFSGFTKHKQFYCTPQCKKQFNCKHCDKTYFSLGALKMHIRTHTLPCKCKVCGKAFSRPWLLQGHMRTHTGEKPFKCQHCARAFADRSNLRAHLQTHSEIKKYSCKQCDKTFSRMSLLLKHEESSCMSPNNLVPCIFN